MNAVYLWVLGPILLFAAYVLYVVFAGRFTRNVVFRTRTPARPQALGRRGALVNVVHRDEPEPERTAA